MYLKFYLVLVVFGYAALLVRCDDPLLLWTQKSYIWSKIKGLQGHPDQWLPLKLKPYLQSKTYKAGFLYAIAFNPASEEVVWSDIHANSIVKQSLQGNVYSKEDEVKELYFENNAEISSLAVDWLSNNVYFINRVTRSIGIQSLDAEKANINKILFSRDDDVPVALAVDPYEGLVFWTNAATGSIEVASPNDTSPKTVLRGLKDPRSITLDMTSKTLFYTDGKTINRVYYNGTGSDSIYTAPTDHMYLDITLMKDYLLVSTGNNLQIHVHSKTSGDLIGSADIDAEVIHIVAAETLEIPPHSCHVLDCNHLCLNLGINKHAQCACADGFTLDTDGKGCVITPVPTQEEVDDNDFAIIAGAAAAAAFFLLLLALLICCLAVRRCKKDTKKSALRSVSEESFTSPENIPESHVYENGDVLGETDHTAIPRESYGNTEGSTENIVPVPIIPVSAEKAEKSFKSRISSHSTKASGFDGQSQPGSDDTESYEIPSPDNSPPPSSTVSLSSIQSTRPLSGSNNFQLQDSKKVATVIQRLTNRLRKGLSSIRFNETQRRPGIDTDGNEDMPHDSEAVHDQIRSYPETAKFPPNKRKIHIPSKLHKEPRGWAPASHNVPRTVISTLGRAKGQAVAEAANVNVQS